MTEQAATQIAHPCQSQSLNVHSRRLKATGEACAAKAARHETAQQRMSWQARMTQFPF